MTGDNLCEVSTALQCSCSATGWTEFSSNIYPQRNGTRGKVRPCHGVLCTVMTTFYQTEYYKILNLLSKKLAGLLVNTNSNSLNYNSHFTQTFILLRLLCQWWNSFTIARIISLPFINFVFCSLADCHATDSSKISQRGCWLPPIYLAVEWTSKESTLFSITTCQRTLTPTFTGFVNSFHSFWKGVSFSVVSTSIETCFVMGK